MYALHPPQLRRQLPECFHNHLIAFAGTRYRTLLLQTWQKGPGQASLRECPPLGFCTPCKSHLYAAAGQESGSVDADCAVPDVLTLNIVTSGSSFLMVLWHAFTTCRTGDSSSCTFNVN